MGLYWKDFSDFFTQKVSRKDAEVYKDFTRRCSVCGGAAGAVVFHAKTRKFHAAMELFGMPRTKDELVLKSFRVNLSTCQPINQLHLHLPPFQPYANIKIPARRGIVIAAAKAIDVVAQAVALVQKIIGAGKKIDVVMARKSFVVTES